VKWTKWAVLTISLLCSMTAFSGGVEKPGFLSRVKFYAEVGVSYAYVYNELSDTHFLYEENRIQNGVDTRNVFSNSADGINFFNVNGLQPTVNVGVSFLINPRWELGVFAIYKYFGNMLLNNYFRNIFFESYYVQTNLKHEFGLLPTLLRNVVHFQVYFGLGPVLLATSISARNIGFVVRASATSPGTDTSTTLVANNKIMMGLIGKIGLHYFFYHAYYLGVAYSYTYARKKRIGFSYREREDFPPATIGYGDEKFSANSNFIAQQFSLTLGVRI
jgi:hypothetical protein